MNNIVVLLPVLIPFVAGVILIFFKNFSTIQRTISGLAAFILLFSSVFLTYHVYQDGILTLEAGNWSAPFGIIFVADLFAGLMTILSGIVGVACLFFAYKTIHKDREKFYFYPFYFFLLTGVNGAFLTGDIFNLFVFFEVMLISSYILIVMGGTKYQLRESFKYVVINIFASALFLIALAFLYSLTGTLNFAHLAQRIAEAEQTGVFNVVAILLLIVFAMKAALFPLYFWLPNSYYGPPTAIAAIFGGLLTKVGVYAIFRVFTLVFIHNIDFTHSVILFLAGATMFVGILGAVAKFDFRHILSYQIISHVGYMIMGLALFTPYAIAGAIFYIAHDMIVKTSLFLYAGVTQKITGTTDLTKMGGLLRTYPLLGWLFFISAIALAGIPPLSGFFGKFAMIVAGLDQGQYIIVFISLLVGLLTLYSMIRIFIYVFWGEPKIENDKDNPVKIMPLLLPIIPLAALTIAMGVFAEPIFSFSMEIAEQLLDPSQYIESVFKE
ncbi:Na+/H+ antiporter subunit D [Salipaludibacillus neizhouensis]|uniref:Na+/H+ antiporter subunit D n=1 Tax=Salipaludibacillus neizhouensis TaxID=885475 RepID=A0A3A9K7X9_9BACI|nr:Na+/H+ antiporter subunit D [Salipaludibacillus neizhouensis]RKL68637.1 Na+/H+ antiporter subunit D [Salipaludibacillus neizhouensis]